MYVIDTDVLVIGGGLAALRAALSARAAGARVAVAVKRKLGQSGSSAATTGGYAVALENDEIGDSPEVHYADILRGGSHVSDPALAAAVSAEAPIRFQDLERWGARFQREGGSVRRVGSGDHSKPRVALPPNNMGTDLTLPLREAVIAGGCTVLENAPAVEILVRGGEAVGALCLTRGEGRLIAVKAGAAILAAGGAGRLFEVTSNPADVTGDGYALGFRAGAHLRDMEFIQFYPWRMIRPPAQSRLSIQPPTFIYGGILLNARGERFMLRYDPERTEGTTRAIAARAIYDQIRQGLGIEGGVALDISGMPPDKFLELNPKIARYFKNRGIEAATAGILVAPEAHYFMGGLEIDEHGRTTLPRLYAVGEVSGGIHGGNRIDSNALPETQVFGHRAGVHAAGLARGKRGPELPDATLREWAARVRGLEPAGDTNADFADLRRELQRAAWAGLGIIRNAAGMLGGLEAFARLWKGSDRIPIRTAQDVEAAFELDSLITTAELCCRAALHREESRGAHYREDFPNQDDARWLRTILLERDPSGFARIDSRPIPTPSPP